MRLSIVFFMVLLTVGCANHGIVEKIDPEEIPRWDINRLAGISQSKLPSGLAKVIPMIADEEFGYVEKYYNGLFKAYEKDPTNERDLHLALDLITSKHQRTKGGFDEYVILHTYVLDESYVAHLLKGLAYAKTGWRERGGRYNLKVTEQQIYHMNFYFNVALRELDAAIELNPKDVFARSYKIDILRNYKSRVNELEETYKKAIEANPLSLVVRTYYMSSLQPKWGGSIERMEALVEEAETYANSNQKLLSLASWTYDYQAEKYWDKKEYEKSISSRIKAADKALGAFKAYQHYKLGDIFYNQGKFTKALAELEKSIEIMPTRLTRIKYKESVEEMIRSLAI